MSKIGSALESFVAGRIDFDRLRATLSNELKERPAKRRPALQLLERLNGTGRLTPALYGILSKEIEQLSGATPEEHTDTIIEDEAADEPPAEATDSMLDAGTINPRRERDTGGGLMDWPEIFADEGVSEPLAPETASAGVEQSQTAGTTVKVGQVLSGRYLLRESLGQGGMGVVFKALDKRLKDAPDSDRYVAVKVLKEGLIHRREAQQLLQREALQGRRLSHPNIVRVFGYDVHEGIHYITTEILTGERLRSLLIRSEPGSIDRRIVDRILRSVCDGLAYAHELGIVHRDLKPANVFLTKNRQVKLLDFGIAADANGARQEPEGATVPGVILRAHTPSYGSPQMLDGAEADPRDDVYSLGCIAWELITGRHPYDRRPATEARELELKPGKIKGVTRQQRKALLAALSFDADDRPADAGAFLRSFGLDRRGKLKSRSRAPALFGGLLVGAAAGLAAATLLPEPWRPATLIEVHTGYRIPWLAGAVPATTAPAPAAPAAEAAPTPADVPLETLGTAIETPGIPLPTAAPGRPLDETPAAPTLPDIDAPVVDAPAPTAPAPAEAGPSGVEPAPAVTETPPAVETAPAVAVAEPVAEEPAPAVTVAAPPTPAETVPAAQPEPEPAPAETVPADVGVNQPEAPATPVASASEPAPSAAETQAPAAETVAAAEPAAPPPAPVIAPGAGRLSLALAQITVRESEAVLTVDIIRTSGATGRVSVMWRTVAGSGTDQEDYIGTDWTAAEFATGDTQVRQFVPIVSDSLREEDEVLYIELADPTGGAVLGDVTRAEVVIVDDD